MKLSFYILIVIQILCGCSKIDIQPQLHQKSMGISSASLTGTIYYVNSQNGDDINNGSSPSTAWKTFDKVNSVTFQPGDQILLKADGVWTTQLYPKGSGTALSPITISSYGSGSKPLINLGGAPGACVYLRNQSYWIIQNLEVTNYSSIRGDVYREGIFVENNDIGTTQNILVQNNYVHDISGTFRGGNSYDPHAFGGICFIVTSIFPFAKFDNISIQGNTVENCGRSGIAVWDDIWEPGTDLTNCTNVKISNNIVKEIDSDGILTLGCNGAILEYNIASGCGRYREDNQFNGAAGIWSTKGSNCISQFNEAYNLYYLDGNTDGNGFDIDIFAINCIVQYNYSHDNGGGFILLLDASTTSGSIVRYNISQNDLTRVFKIAGGVTPNMQIYNNTIYLRPGSTTNIIDHDWDDGGGLGDVNQPWSFVNNIIYNLGSGDYLIPGPGGTNGSFKYNLFYGNHPVHEPSDANKLTSDPMFVKPGNGGYGINTVNGYKLKAGSSALGSGALISNNGGRDYWGNMVSSITAPNRGAYNGTGLKKK